MSLDATGFIVALVVFTVAVALLQPFLANAMRGQGGNIGALGAVALIATLISLIFTDLVTDGLSIDGIGTWIGAAVVVWLAALGRRSSCRSWASRSTSRATDPHRRAIADG